MSDIRESFPILESAANVGQPITQAVPGTTAATSIASTLAAPVFQNSSGVLVFPQLTPGGAISVDTNASLGTKVHLAASAAGSLTETVVVTLPLTASKMVQDIEVTASCRRGSRFRLTWSNAGVETTLGYWMVDSGQYTIVENLQHTEFTASTGTQELLLYAFNFEKASDLYGYVGCVQY